VTDEHDDDQPARDGTDSADGADSADSVGSVGEEAAKLFDALQDWAAESGADLGGGLGGGLAGGLGGLGEQWRAVNEHIATGGADCVYCPVCQVIHKVRDTSPEVRTHLAVAASSLLQAAAAVLEARAGKPATPEPKVTKIDLDDPED
jgi:hypothetical protein